MLVGRRRPLPLLYFGRPLIGLENPIREDDQGSFLEGGICREEVRICTYPFSFSFSFHIISFLLFYLLLFCCSDEEEYMISGKSCLRACADKRSPFMDVTREPFSGVTARSLITNRLRSLLGHALPHPTNPGSGISKHRAIGLRSLEKLITIIIHAKYGPPSGSVIKYDRVCRCAPIR